MMSSKDPSSAGTESDAAAARGASVAPSPPASARADDRGAAWRRVASDVGAGARTAAPVIKRVGTRVGDWLARIGWGKFFVLAILLLIFGNIVSSALFDRAPAVVVERGGDPDVAVSVNVTSDGVKIVPGRPAQAPTPPAPPAVPAASAPPAPPAVTPPAAPAPDSAAGKPAATPAGVVIDDSGVRIVADDNGRKVTVQIDGRGIRVTEGARPAAAAGTAGTEGEVVIDAAAATDPQKMAEAIETARSKIEEIVSDQVRQQVAQRTRVYQESSSDWFNTFIVLLIVTGIIVKIVLGSKRKAEVRAQAATATAAEEGLKRQLAEAQLKMMQAQVEPHFLFNTLASVDYLIETDPARASTMQKNLIQYLRAALPQMREGSTTLGKELSLCRAYLEILKVRMEDRLQFAITVPQGLSSAQFPPMMLQSLVENAIKHGLEPKPEGGTLTLTANISHGVLRVTVADTGLGFGAGTTAGTGVGLANVRERLAALYGGQARLNVEANTPTGTIATIEVPYVIDTRATPADGGGPVPQPA
jgi:signal transduction histidine kinase